ncbi:MAG: MBL fold metallo-hydrolase [Deltaproteobacteria bacterium]|nr:MBL fold metallo-hydrolase [Deltaproteobacteria bacterium]
MTLRCARAFSVFLITLLFLVNMAEGAGPEAIRLADGVYAFIGENGSTNSGFVVTEEGVVVIDSQGPRELALTLRSKIRAVTDKPVIYVINTHYHGDHTFGNQYFTENLIAIVSHEATRELLIERDAGHREMFLKFFGPESLLDFKLTLPQVTFTERLTLRAGEKTLELVSVPKAHTEGDIYVYMPEEKILFAGDLLYKGRLPFMNDGDSLGAVKAVDELLTYGAARIVPGHGGLSDRDDAAAYKGYLTDLRAEVKRLKESGKTLEEVKGEIRLPKYSLWYMYNEWLPANAAKVYTELD